MKTCAFCGHDVQLDLELVKEIDQWMCKDWKACHVREMEMQAPCCGIPEAPHPGCCDHSWERCAECTAPGPTWTDYDGDDRELWTQWEVVKGKAVYLCPEHGKLFDAMTRQKSKILCSEYVEPKFLIATDKLRTCELSPDFTCTNCYDCVPF